MIDELRLEIGRHRESLVRELAEARSAADITSIRECYLARKRGVVTLLLERLKALPAAEKPALGKEINEFKGWVTERIEEAAARQSSAVASWFDPTLPADEPALGHLHLLTQTQRELQTIFARLGYAVAEGPEIESDYFNFTALNMDEDHPARDEHDTFFIDGWPDRVLRTHTSPMQIRHMQANRPPIQIIVPGKAFRKDEPDATHSPMFQQIEGLRVDRGISFAHLKGTLEAALKAFYGSESRIRFRPSYFPFTEPSAEVDVSCFLCGGADRGCRICKGTGWLEVLGSGMVHPQVLRNGGIDPEIYSGFAFGMGIERNAMLRFGVTDIRYLYENDLRLLSQFA